MLKDCPCNTFQGQTGNLNVQQGQSDGQSIAPSQASGPVITITTVTRDGISQQQQTQGGVGFVQNVEYVQSHTKAGAVINKDSSIDMVTWMLLDNHGSPWRRGNYV